jgi:hypothetical protein
MNPDRAGGGEALIPFLLEPNANDVVQRNLLDDESSFSHQDAKVGENVLEAAVEGRVRERRRGRPEKALPGLHVANLRRDSDLSNRVTECESPLQHWPGRSDTHIRMLWIFGRKGEQMSCEIRRDGVGEGYEMIVTSPDGSQRMERFEETSDLIKRSLDLQLELMESGWRRPK